MKSRWFSRLASISARATGKPMTFMLALAVVAVWAITGPVFHYSDTWQLVINTGTTIITFLMVFLIQNTQNRDGYALQVKLDEVIRSLEGAHNALLDLEELDEQTLERIRTRYRKLAEKAREQIRSGGFDIGREDVEPDAEPADGGSSGRVRRSNS